MIFKAKTFHNAKNLGIERFSYYQSQHLVLKVITHVSNMNTNIFCEPNKIFF